MRLSKALPYLPLAALLGVLSLAWSGCGRKSQETKTNTFIFNPVDTAYGADSLIIPGGKYKVKQLFTEGAPVKLEWKGVLAPAKGMHHLALFLPINGAVTHGILFVDHQSTMPDAQIGDGGGATVIEVFRDTVDGWKVVGYPHAVDFSSVGGTMNNGLGTVTPWGTLLISEDIEPQNSLVANPQDSSLRLFSDSTLQQGRPSWMNHGWMVEIDPNNWKVQGKRWAMGRMKHEGCLAMADSKTIYMADNHAPGALFKFVADTAGNLRSGRLYAWRAKADSLGRHWVTVPDGRDTLLHARRYAFGGGASIFMRLEDMELLPDGSILLTESGADSTDLGPAITLGGQVMPHHSKYHLGNNLYDDRHGRILRYDPNSEQITVFLEGGQALEDKSIVLSNPANMALDPKHKLLVIQEDLHGTSAGRVPERRGAVPVSEIYFLKLPDGPAALDQLKRFAMIPRGCKSTGACWSPDYTALFFNIQAGKHPSISTKRGPQLSRTVVVTGFPE